MGKKILVTGAAGFIGFHLVKQLIQEDYQVVGIDNLNDYYDVNLKLDRLKELGISVENEFKYNEGIVSTSNQNFLFIKQNLQDRESLPSLFQKENFDIVCNLAAQAGVRYSLENPDAYIDSNLTGFANLLECCRHNNVTRLIFASSSSVYGNNEKMPFSTEDRVDMPVSLYAATKKSNELMAYTYSHLYDMETVGLRFFTVYGPWGRPDMAMFLFTDAISNDLPIKVFNHGNLERDFTYIDDIVAGIMKITNKEKIENDKKYSLYNIGNSKPVRLFDFITEIEKNLGKSAEKKMLPMQPGDVERTWADVSPLKEDFGYNPSTTVKDGVKRFIDWYNSYYKAKV